MSEKSFTININLDAKCKECGKGGATPCGFCLGCVNKAMSGKPMKTEAGKAYAKWEKNRSHPATRGGRG